MEGGTSVRGGWAGTSVGLMWVVGLGRVRDAGTGPVSQFVGHENL